ncbi:hypothetical protein IJ531_00115 [bacterium]|nr:hypothetical protein [bacterium]
MNFLKEQAIPLDKQLHTWHDIVKRPYNRDKVCNYTRTRQILMNGIEVEAWCFKHAFVRMLDDPDLKKTICAIRRIEDLQQTTINWLCPANQTVLDTTLGYEQVAVDLTAWLAQNEDNKYVKETFDFGLLEDFDHLYRYSQFINLVEETDPNDILHNQTDVLIGRPTQYHHNCNMLRVRNPYDKDKTSPKTKVNILTLVSAEQQTHNFYSEHGFMYGNTDLKRLYAEIKDVEEEHVTMYETLIDPRETWLEKWLLHEFTEACCYYNCYLDETDERIKLIYEEMFKMELAHLQKAAKKFEEFEKRDPESIIGDCEILPCSFKSQKEYVKKVLYKETNKRVDKEGNYNTVDALAPEWGSYVVQKALNDKGAPSERAIEVSIQKFGRDIALSDSAALSKQPELLEKSLENYKAPNTVGVDEYKKFSEIKPDIYLY